MQVAQSLLQVSIRDLDRCCWIALWGLNNVSLRAGCRLSQELTGRAVNNDGQLNAVTFVCLYNLAPEDEDLGAKIHLVRIWCSARLRLEREIEVDVSILSLQAIGSDVTMLALISFERAPADIADGFKGGDHHEGGDEQMLCNGQRHFIPLINMRRQPTNGRAPELSVKQPGEQSPQFRLPQPWSS